MSTRSGAVVIAQRSGVYASGVGPQQPFIVRRTCGAMHANDGPAMVSVDF